MTVFTALTNTHNQFSYKIHKWIDANGVQYHAKAFYCTLFQCWRCKYYFGRPVMVVGGDGEAVGYFCRPCFPVADRKHKLLRELWNIRECKKLINQLKEVEHGKRSGNSK